MNYNLFTKSTDIVVKLTRTKPQVFKMNEQRKAISFDKSLKLQDEWMLSLTRSEVYSCVFWVKPKKTTNWKLTSMMKNLIFGEK